MRPNDKIGNKYRLVRKLGTGSFGEVWEAEDIVLDLEVAVKFYVALDEEGQKEFQTEYKNTYGLNHSNLLTAKSYDFFENRPYLVMDLCPDGSTSKLCGKFSGSKEDRTEIWRFIHDVASGLAYLHAKDIVHQDIKPANILKNISGEYVITDFGISRNLRATMRKQSKRQADDGSGAIAYMAPERFSSDATPVKASDIWSLGASIYELITGILPFNGMGGVLQQKGADIPNLPEDFKEFNDVLHQCLAINPWDRISASNLSLYAERMIEGGYVPSTTKRSFPRWIWIVLAVLLVMAVSIFALKRCRTNPSEADCAANEQQFLDTLESFTKVKTIDYVSGYRILNNAFLKVH